jgi:hypothetical protein
MNMLIMVLLILLILIALLYFFFSKKAPSTQVTNNSGTRIHMVKVGGVEFTENLSYCADGCSTGFINVPQGTNNIQLQQTSGGSWIDLGDLGLFEKGLHYSVNIKSNDLFCVELWKRHQTSTTFNDDTTRELVASNCS